MTRPATVLKPKKRYYYCSTIEKPVLIEFWEVSNISKVIDIYIVRKIQNRKWIGRLIDI